MIGIYRITNVETNQSYIGQSIDIKRRWAEHKAPSANGNDTLHNDMHKYGLNKFVFEIIEECEPSKLSERELFYIRKENPFYNTVGRKKTKDEKKKISDSLKKWWRNLPKSTQQRIIQNNLKGPKKGHIVSDEARQKIGLKVSESQKVKVKCIETGEVYDSIGDFEKTVGACTGTCAAYWKGKIKSVKGYHVEKCRD